MPVPTIFPGRHKTQPAEVSQAGQLTSSSSSSSFFGFATRVAGTDPMLMDRFTAMSPNLTILRIWCSVGPLLCLRLRSPKDAYLQGCRSKHQDQCLPHCHGFVSHLLCLGCYGQMSNICHDTFFLGGGDVVGRAITSISSVGDFLTFGFATVLVVVFSSRLLLLAPTTHLITIGRRLAILARGKR